MSLLSCCHCNCYFEIYRNPTQTYCSETACQNARKQKWRRQKLKDDASYQENQKSSQARWVKKNTDYWRRYREQHPAYQEKNRQQQRERQQKIRRLVVFQAQEQSTKSVLTRGEYYQVIPLELANNASLFATRPLAKSDALLVEISFMTMG